MWTTVDKNIRKPFEKMDDSRKRIRGIHFWIVCACARLYDMILERGLKLGAIS